MNKWVFCGSIKYGETKRELYLYGPMVVGKSAITSAVADVLAKRVEVFSYEKIVIFERLFDGQLSDMKVIKIQKQWE